MALKKGKPGPPLGLPLARDHAADAALDAPPLGHVPDAPPTPPPGQALDYAALDAAREAWRKEHGHTSVGKTYA